MLFLKAVNPNSRRRNSSSYRRRLQRHCRSLQLMVGLWCPVPRLLAALPLLHPHVM
jgi:hypothetical protein